MINIYMRILRQWIFSCMKPFDLLARAKRQVGPANPMPKYDFLKSL
jgi:hypothetical protein